MEFLIFIVFVLFMIVYFSKSILGKSAKTISAPVYPFFKNSSLLTPAELSFKHTLKIAVSDKYEINSKVRLADLISVQKSQSKSQWQKSFNQIKAKHIDFVLVDAKTAEILCAIELDDSSHTRADRKSRDSFLDEALKSANLPLFRFSTSRAYQSKEIWDAISSILGSSMVIEQPKDDKQLDNIEVLIEPELRNIQAEELPERTCPKCKAFLIERTASRGANSGTRFWGCSNFPQCRYRELIEETS